MAMTDTEYSVLGQQTVNSSLNSAKNDHIVTETEMQDFEGLNLT